MKKVITETGSVYYFDMDNMKMRRAEHTKKSQELRKDGDWLDMLLEPQIQIGKRMTIALSPLGDPATTDCTVRYTTEVLSVEDV